MTGDRLYEMVQEMLANPSLTPYACYLRTKLLIRCHLMVRVEIVTFKWRAF